MLDGIPHDPCRSVETMLAYHRDFLRLGASRSEQAINCLQRNINRFLHDNVLAGVQYRRGICGVLAAWGANADGIKLRMTE